MKIINKILSVLVLVCMVSLLIPQNVEAASGRVRFNDPTVAAGDEFDVNINIMTYDSAINSIYIELEYDNSIIEYKSGDYSKLENGMVVIEAGSGDIPTEVILKFRALKEQNNSITIASCTVEDSSGNVFDMQEGNSAIKISGGVEVEPEEIEEEMLIDDSKMIIQVSGVDYIITSEFSEAKIPLGFTQAKVDIEGVMESAVVGDDSDIVLAYLIPASVVEDDAEGLDGFFIYNEDTGVFSPYIVINVSDTTSIAFLAEEYPEELPLQFIPTTMKVNGYDFPAWEDSSNPGYYLVYAITDEGNKCLYRYDVEDQSYQRFNLEKEAENPNAVSDPQLQEVIDFIANNLLLSLAVVVLILIFLIILVMVFGIKLRNRNKELDDIYIEGGMISGYDENPNKGQAKSKRKKDFFDFDDEYDEEYDEDFDDEYDDEQEEYSKDIIKANSPLVNMDEFDSTNVEGGMLDDGMTHEFSAVALENAIYQNDFVETPKSNDFGNIEQLEYDDEDDFEDDYLYESPKADLNKPKRKLFGKKQKNDDNDYDDGFEFIDL